MTYYLASQWNQQDMDRFGGAMDSAEDAGLMIVGDEFSEIDGYELLLLLLVVVVVAVAASFWIFERCPRHIYFVFIYPEPSASLALLKVRERVIILYAQAKGHFLSLAKIGDSVHALQCRMQSFSRATFRDDARRELTKPFLRAKSHPYSLARKTNRVTRPIQECQLRVSLYFPAGVRCVAPRGPAVARGHCRRRALWPSSPGKIKNTPPPPKQPFGWQLGMPREMPFRISAYLFR